MVYASRGSKSRQEVEKGGLTEEELMSDLEVSKREVFEEQYGQLR